jgi:hypothetical protein
MVEAGSGVAENFRDNFTANNPTPVQRWQSRSGVANGGWNLNTITLLQSGP